MFTSAILAGTRTLARRRALLSSLAMGVLAACAGAPAPQSAAPQTALAETQSAPAVPRPRHPPPLPARKPTPPGEAAVAAVEEAPAAPAMAAPPPQEAELVGLDEKAATSLFGTAAERAEKAPATVWRYKTESCELDLYFYLDLSSGRMRTLHYAFKGEADDAVKRQECLRAIADRGRRGPEAQDAASAHR